MLIAARGEPQANWYATRLGSVGMRALVIAAHLFLGVGWLGAMSYSLFMVQPKAARYFAADGDAHEDFLTTLAHGARWKVVGLIAALAATGVIAAVTAADRTTGWWVGIAAKAALLLAASGVFWWVSWRAWPARVFALPAERARWRLRFRIAALTMLGCGGVASFVGVLITRR
jgi:hypothetical protein